MEITSEIQVRFADLDAYGHVNNAVYLSYLEIARVELIHDLFLKDMERNIQYLLIKVNLDYHQPIVLSDKVFVHCWWAETGKVKFKAAYRLHDGKGKTFATGYTEHALFDGNKKRIMRMPEEWKAFASTPSDVD
ncbi:MAG: acyl-CoA thioesterase [Deferribacteraceae bacterium]|nr:acyl-CoA thioesterase [Deferribacteraceae bacterium]